MIKYPQTKCTKLAAYSHYLSAVANFGCLAMCYLYCAGIDGDEVDYIINCARAIDEGYLDKDCTVLDADKFLKAFTGKKVSVSKKAVNAVSVKEIKNPTPVRYDYDGHSHWVVVQNGTVVFNSLINSVCVARGKPTTSRVIKWV